MLGQVTALHVYRAHWAAHGSGAPLGRGCGAWIPCQDVAGSGAALGSYGAAEACLRASSSSFSSASSLPCSLTGDGRHGDFVLCGNMDRVVRLLGPGLLPSVGE